MVKQNEIINQVFPRKLKTGSKNKVNTGEDEIANEFNNYFANIGSSLGKSTPYPSLLFESFLKRANTTSTSQSLSIKELEDTFFVWKQAKVLALTKKL